MYSISQSQTKDGASDKAQPPEKVRPSGHMVWVQCKGYRCLAFRDEQDRWVNFYSGERLTDFVRVIH
jgi:hypothetical protein